MSDEMAARRAKLAGRVKKANADELKAQEDERETKRRTEEQFKVAWEKFRSDIDIVKELLERYNEDLLEAGIDLRTNGGKAQSLAGKSVLDLEVRINRADSQHYDKLLFRLSTSGLRHGLKSKGDHIRSWSDTIDVSEVGREYYDQALTEYIEDTFPEED